jgi:hypothetical protein
MFWQWYMFQVTNRKNHTQQSVPDDHRDNTHLRYVSASRFLGSSFFYSQADATPAQVPVTKTVRQATL